MKPSVVGAMIGAIVGFTVVLALYVFVIQSRLVHALLFPGRFFIHYATIEGVGDFGLMMFDFLAYFSNIVLYAAIGFGLGKLLETRRGGNASQPK